MSNDLHQCPNCGAYVMSGDNTCPRCDYRFEPDEAAPAEPVPDEPAVTESEPDEAAWAGAHARANLPTDVIDPVPDETTEAPLLHLRDDDDAPETEAAPADNAQEPALLEPAPETAILAEPGVDFEDITGPSDILPPPADDAAASRAAAGRTPRPMVPVQFAAEESAVTLSGATPAHIPDNLPAPAAVAAASAIPAASAISAAQDATLPPAPFTPPPMRIQPPQPAYPSAYSPAYGYSNAAALQSAGIAYVQQRVQAYLRGGYRVVTHAPHEATLAHGKSLSVGGWLLALLTIIGALWYMLILVVSGFKPDMAYLVLESDGRVYEDGPGAAHVRDARSRAGRRWALFGLFMAVLCAILALVLGAAAAVILSQDRYQAALRNAYPAISLFEERFSDAASSPDDVDLAKTGSIVFAVLGGIALIGLWAGATLFVIGTVQASAYRVSVPPLPAYG